jgi:hypothetical protein
MRLRIFTLAAALALVAAACSPSTDTAEPSATEDQPAETTSTTAAAQTSATTDAILLSYNLVAGETFTYEVGIDQRIEMTAEGNSAALGDDEIPGEMAINLVGTTTFSHSVADGPEPGTYEVTIKGDFTDLAITGTVDGASIEDSDLPDFAELDPIDVTIVVDEQGNIIPQDDELGDLFGEDLGGLGGLGDFGGMGSSPGQFVGPPFSEEEVTVGDTWSKTIELPGMMTEEPITTEVNSEVVGTDTVDGNDVFIIDTESVTSMIEFDLAEFLLGFMTAFVPDDASAEDTEALDALTEDLRFLFIIDETVSNLTTWFDTEAGFARMAEFESSTNIVMDLNMPDDETGEMVGFVMDMSIAQDISYRLTDTSNA